MTNPQQVRKNVVVLFADIAGYSAITEKDEDHAMKLVNRFREIAELGASRFDGSIIQYYGDGLLATFQDEINAVGCAISLQQTFQMDPNIPVRIGIHNGSVIEKEGNIYGEVVNTTSRIESMGAPGSILISEEVSQKLVRDTEFKTISLGKYQFKNMANPMEVFAIANQGIKIPRKEEIKGKTVERKSSGNKLLILITSILILGLAVVYFSGVLNSGSGKQLQLEKYGRVAVMVFEDNTSDPALKDLGKAASDWISNGLIETGLVDVTSPHTIRDIKPEALQASGELGKFGQSKEIQSMVMGAYYTARDSIIINSNLIDVKSNNILYPFSTIRVPKSNAYAGIESLMDEIMGFFAANRNLNSPNLTAPLYEAYIANINGQENIGVNDTLAIEYLENAIALDPGFLEPYIHLIQAHFLIGNPPIVDSILQFLKLQSENLSEYDMNNVEYWEAFLNGDFLTAYNRIKNNLSKDPYDPFSNYRTGHICIDGLNRPSEGLEILNKIDEKDESRHRIKHDFRNRIDLKSNALMKLEQYGKAFELNDWAFQKMENISFVQNKVRSLIRMNNREELNQLNEDVKYRNLGVTASDQHIGDILANAAKEYFLIGENELASNFAQQAIQEYEELNESFHYKIAEVHYISGDFENASASFYKAHLQSHDSLDIMDNIALHAVSLIKSGKKDEAEVILLSLDNYGFAFEQGCTVYNKARIHLALGDRSTAIQLIKQARKEGMRYYYRRYGWDYSLVDLFDHPEFQAIVKADD